MSPCSTAPSDTRVFGMTTNDLASVREPISAIIRRRLWAQRLVGPSLRITLGGAAFRIRSWAFLISKLYFSSHRILSQDLLCVKICSAQHSEMARKLLL